MAEFDLAALLQNSVSKLDTNREQIQYIKLTAIDEDKNNFYELSDIDGLAANITFCGLQQPIRVRASEKPGRYKVVSGHRRRAALTALAKEDPSRWMEVPCIVEQDAASDALQQLRLIYANASNRKLTSAELGEQAAQVERLLYQLKEEGYEFPGRMRDHVAQAVQSSTTKLARLKVIRDNLIPMWVPDYQNGGIKESVAYALSQLSPEWQNVMYNRWGASASCLHEGHVKNIQEHIDKIFQLKCRAHKGCGCSLSYQRMKHIAGLGRYDVSCSGCCLDCTHLASCKDSCYLADMKKTSLQAKLKETRAAEKAAAQEKNEPVLQYIRGVYSRWSACLAAKGMSADDYLRACGRTWIDNDSKQFEKRANNPQKITCTDTKLPFSNNIWPSDAKSLIAAADVLGCSIDWLLGRDVPGPQSPDPEPVTEPAAAASMWHTGHPKKDGEYIVFRKNEHWGAGVDTFDWKDGQWLEFDDPIADEYVLFWTEIPEEV